MYSMSISFIENHPVLSALAIAVLFLCAVAFELLGLKQKAVSTWTAVLGTMGIVACFTGADRFGPSSVFAVGIVLVFFWSGLAVLWRKA
jgi:hypothetical protein